MNKQTYLIKKGKRRDSRNAHFSKLVKSLLLSSIISGTSLISGISNAQPQIAAKTNVEGEYSLDYRLEHGLLEESKIGLLGKIKNSTPESIQAAKNWYYDSLGTPTPAPGYIWVNPGNQNGDFSVRPEGVIQSEFLEGKIKAKTEGIFNLESFNYFIEKGIPFGYVYNNHSDGKNGERDGKKQIGELEGLNEKELKNNRPIIFEAYLGKVKKESNMEALGPDKKTIYKAKLDPSCGCNMGRYVIPKGAPAGDYIFSVYTDDVVLCSFHRTVSK